MLRTLTQPASYEVSYSVEEIESTEKGDVDGSRITEGST